MVFASRVFCSTMLSFKLLKSSGMQNKALKLFSPLLNSNKSRNFCFRKLNPKYNIEGKFRKLTSTLGYGVGIAVFIGISSFHIRRLGIVPEKIGFNFGQCEASYVPGDTRDPESPRNKFNFLADVVEKTQNSVVYIEIIAR